MPLVSVILPNYNHSKYLPQRIDSVLSQTFRDFELIILDDCSTDSSRQIIDSYKGRSEISNIVFNENNSGSTFLQWEKGIRLAKGKYIWLAESDDFADPHFLEQILKVMTGTPGTGVAFCASNITDENNHVSRKNYEYSASVNNLMSGDFVMDGRKFCEDYLFFGCLLVNASAVVFEKELFEKVDQDYKSYKVSGDWRMWVELCYNTNVGYINQSLNYFRFHNNNVRTNKASTMNGEAIRNYIASHKKTMNDKVRKRLKDRLVKHWFFEFSRDLKNFRFSKSMTYLRDISSVDSLFIFRLAGYLLRKTFGVRVRH